jgi:hypothetical protein
MGNPRLTRTFGLVVAVLIVAVTGAAYATVNSSAPTISACVHHAGGGIYMARRCAARDRRLTWNITGPQGPPGPQGSAGSVGPQGAAGPLGPSAAFSVDRHEGVPITGSLTRVASLAIPVPGDYVIFAKTWLANASGQAQFVGCQLFAGEVAIDGSRRDTDTDESVSAVNDEATLALNVVHVYTAPRASDVNNVDLECQSEGQSIAESDTKITAIRVGTLANTQLP